ncbi:GNAT family N-acetyltransferase [Thermoflexus sp.]|mgnify:CR=1 FL=1|jgi:amino-acid N-acetyltransferase|uniref:GNAT family N-acetyltransferase n=1 Tax=Thermoflexus sp. TaxID=1969742 RepID=UPI003C0FD632
MEDWILRPARPGDGPIIRRMIREARLNPFGLHIPRFWVAEVQGRVVGAVQIRPHRDGSRELASLVVDPAWRGRGIGSALVRAQLARVREPLVLICRPELEPFYARFGFRRLRPEEMPPFFRWTERIARWLGRPLRIMGWDPAEAAGEPSEGSQ